MVHNSDVRTATNELTLAVLIGILWRRLWLLAGVTLGAFFLLIFLSTLVRPTYNAETLVEIALPRAEQELQAVDPRVVQLSVDRHLATLRSSDFIAKVVSELEKEGLLQPPRPNESRLRIVQNTLRMLGMSSPADASKSVQVAVHEFSKQFTTGQNLQSNIIFLRFKSRDPEVAYRTTNRLAEMYLADQQAKSSALIKQANVRTIREIETLKQRIRNNREAMRSKVRAVAEASGDPSLQAVRTQELSELSEDVGRDTKLLVSLQSKQLELSMRSTYGESGLRILSRALPPVGPSSLHPIVFIVPGTILSLLIGGIGVIVWAQLDRSLRTANDVRRVLGISRCELVPKLRRPAARSLLRNLLSSQETPLPFELATRSIVTDLQTATKSRPANNVILVTSSVAKEGKTTLALSIASYMSRIDKRVLFVDLDWTSRNFLNELDSDYLELIVGRPRPENLSIKSLKNANNVGIHYLSLASYQEDPTELSKNGSVSKSLAELRKSYDTIIVDCPPVLGNPEAGLLADIADQILFVLTWADTREEVAIKALGELERRATNGRKLVQSVFPVINKVPPEHHILRHYGEHIKRAAVRAGTNRMKKKSGETRRDAVAPVE